MNFYHSIITGISYLKQPVKRATIRLAFTLKGKTGLEVGGPSSFFSLKSCFPVYLLAKRIDFVNFSNETVWEGKIEEGENLKYSGNKTGVQYIREASDLSDIQHEKYDFLLSCHCLEHVANPLKALFEWNRVLKKNGAFVLVLPDKRNTFDHNRPYTHFEHILEDYKSNRSEDDKTHFDEVINLLDISKTETLRSKNELVEMVNKNSALRCVHHHVYDFNLISEMLDYTGFSIKSQSALPPFHLFTYATKN